MNGVTPREVVRTLLVLVAVVILQFTVCLNLRIAGAHPDLVLGVPLVAGLVMGARKGAMVGFVVGIGADLLLPTPFGLTALVGSVTGCLAGLVTDAGFEANPVLLTPMVALVGSAISVVFEAALGAIVGQQQMLKADLASIVGVVGVSNAVVSLPLRRVLSWASSRDRSPWRSAIVGGDQA